MNTDESIKLLARIDERTILIMDQLEEVKKCHTDHEDRIRSLERWQWKATGIATGISGFFGAVAGMFLGKGGS